MNEIKYKLTATWMAPNIPTFIKEDECVAAIGAVRVAQNSLTKELQLLDLTKRDDHFKLFAFNNVSFQLSQMVSGLESVLRYMRGDEIKGTQTPDVYTTSTAHRRTLSKEGRNDER